MPRLIEKKLNALSVKRLAKPGRHADGSGLYLNVEKSGSKSWLLRVTVNGRARTIGLGSVLDVTLAEAREKASKLRRVAKDGGDPLAERDGRGKDVPAFKVAAEQVFQEHNQAWKNERHRQQWIRSLREYAFPVIGDKRVDEIGSSDVLEVLQPIWLSKAETARRVKQRMHAVFDWCYAKHYCESINPVDAVRRALPKQALKKKHFPALPYDELPAFIEGLRAADVDAVVKLGLEFLIHTVARTGEVLGAQWNEVDTRQKIWTVPAARIKAGVEHRVPLSGHSLELFERTQAFRGKSLYMLPGRNWKNPLSHMVFFNALRRIGRDDITVHGFRSSFRDWTAERTSTPHDVCETALAHQVRDQVEAAYKRTDLLDQRRPLMEEWSQFLEQH